MSDIIIKGGAIVFALGITIGSVMLSRHASSVEESKRKQHAKFSKVLQTLPSVYEPLETMAAHKRAHIGQLERVGRRCASLLQAYIKVTNSKPETVKPSIIALGSRYTESIKYHLHCFYVKSDIVTVANDVNGKHLEPVNRDIKLAHETLIMAIECLAQSLEICAREKLEQGVANKV